LIEDGLGRVLAYPIIARGRRGNPRPRGPRGGPVKAARQCDPLLVFSPAGINKLDPEPIGWPSLAKPGQILR
jgi:hypothetical protein